jgi:hypothetical protein
MPHCQTTPDSKTTNRAYGSFFSRLKDALKTAELEKIDLEPAGIAHVGGIADGLCVVSPAGL